jgi:hypothetical protein
MHFEIEVNAKADLVYKKMLEDKTYREWTKAFNPTSFYKGSWDKGSKILFLGTDDKGEEGGMVSRIKENIANKFVSIEHIGMVSKGKEITSGKEVESWAGALENYTFIETNGKTLVSVDLHMEGDDQMKSYFIDTWPKALDTLKEICEN